MSFCLVGLLLGFWSLPIGPIRTFHIFIIGWLEKSGSEGSIPPPVR